jgi:coenzyme F420-0:L-glutamate ligase/coenzyme F420-1:gamma-L-glutamate ligase
VSIVILPLAGIPEVRPDDDLAAHLGAAIETSRYGLKDGDILVVCQKVVSKAEGRVVDLADVEPGEKALAYAAEHDKDARVVELALGEAEEVLRMVDGHLITATAGGFICANAGLDRSNQSAEGRVTLLPKNSDASAAALRDRLRLRFGARIGVIVSDTFGRPWRIGQLDVAIGAAGLEVLEDYAGKTDRSGRVLEHTSIAVADQIAAAAGMAMGKADGIPAVLVRGAPVRMGAGLARDLVRPREQDLFR